MVGLSILISLCFVVVFLEIVFICFGIIIGFVFIRVKDGFIGFCCCTRGLVFSRIVTFLLGSRLCKDCGEPCIDSYLFLLMLK